jgi:Protein of unknown function (DUF3501)
MNKVKRSELLDFQTYAERRNELRPRAMAEKDKRRVHVGEHLTFLFESSDTIRYQIQEMMRAEQIVREADILHELDTYNELLGDAGELGCTLLIEIDDQGKRDASLRAWMGLPARLYIAVEGGRKVRASWDERQMDSERLSSVQYLKFRTDGARPLAIGADHPALTVEVALRPEQQQLLLRDSEA